MTFGNASIHTANGSYPSAAIQDSGSTAEVLLRKIIRVS